MDKGHRQMSQGGRGRPEGGPLGHIRPMFTELKFSDSNSDVCEAASTREPSCKSEI